MIPPSKRANKDEIDPSTFILPHPAGSFSYSPNMEINFSSLVSTPLTKNDEFPPKFENQNKEPQTLYY